ncbi:dof zinc finger protein DOF4.3-like [Brassica napus]|uniref:Dof zinc finger protein n=2 Tax=Brassica TaxID=3705 RepID=A0A8X7RP19_BRACI|nr:dof zinc finger protein DOF4.3-like [Brassica napus]KAG2291522.1 hypothetical protein Bca52824_038191 [Brassica carinata]VDC99640.1 unnamed protein product [Brassica oleracea]
MDYSSAFAEEGNEVNQEKPPLRVCPRCNSTNTKFCYYNNHSVSQPRYKCKECRRKWTHGGALRNIPIGGSGRKKKSTTIDQPFVSQAVSAEIQQVISRRHQPFLHAQATNQFVRSFGGFSSGFDVENVGSFPGNHGDVVLPFQSFTPMDRSYFHDGLFQQDYYNVESNDLIGNHLNNQSIGSYNVVNSDHNNYINQEDQNKWNQSLNNTMNMNHNASTSGSRESWDIDHMNKYNGNIKNNCVYESSYHLEKHGP